MSYDVYILELKVAIEYQGEQHFKPVDVFGGEQHFIDQKKRDELKAQLSKTHGVKLIYVNYWEDISEELIHSKIKQDSSLFSCKTAIFPISNGYLLGRLKRPITVFLKTICKTVRFSLSSRLTSRGEKTISKPDYV